MAISMNYGMASSDPDPRDPITIYNYNKKQGDTFKVYYSLEAPPSAAPCHDSRPDIGGWRRTGSLSLLGEADARQRGG